MLLETLRYGKHSQNVNIETFCVECQYMLSHFILFCCFKIHYALSLQRLLIVHIVNVFNVISLYIVYLLL